MTEEILSPDDLNEALMDEDLLDDEAMDEDDEASLRADRVEAGQGEPTADGLYEHFRFVADRGQSPIRVDKFLVDRIVGASRNRIQHAADAGYILVDGKPVKSNYKVKPREVVSLMMDRPRHVLEILPEDIPLDIVYEDADVLVVNKPAGLVVHPGCGNYHGTLVNALAWHFKDDPAMAGRMDDPRLGLVHRIDKETSGLLVVAKTEEARTDLALQFFRKTTRRRYTALVWGHVEADEGRIEGNIGRNPKDRLQMAVFPDGAQGKTAVTHYRVLERLGYVTLVECRLETGRTHQIRVHMKWIGHTLFNDSRYGGNAILKGTTFAQYTRFVQHCFDVCPRQALHARTLGFRHPRTGEEMDFEAPLPDDMVQLVEQWRSYLSQREK
jgi:23S rRNA pseudouridine1911/1915/1917 synthase